MKLEDFERATTIKNQLDRIKNLDMLLCQAAKGHNLLASIEKDCYGNVTVLREECLNEEMLTAIRAVVAQKLIILRDEFESL